MIVIDAETSGTDPRRHALVSLGAIDFEHPDRQFYQECRIRADRSVDPGALAVNGFRAIDLLDPSKPDLCDLLHNFYIFTTHCNDRTLAGANCGTFDLRFLEDGLDYCRRQAVIENEPLRKQRLLQTLTGMYLGGRVYELFSTAIQHMKRAADPVPVGINRHGINRTDLCVDDIYEYCGLPREPRPHNALVGAKMTAEAFHRLHYGRPLFIDYHQYRVPRKMRWREPPQSSDEVSALTR